ncbi:chemotaxis protein CheW [uncultured Helicobacter sp.]|uniref:hybrid sensor histidine kinase/response regulator n=1 Tax=uncultured Helicobacter sp. TaxID=175537 RepID=UPI002621E77B|nr:chemotaxis protein CheW [uncultured Helicobacter sp.]
MDEMQEIIEDFLVESFEMIDQLDQDLIELENNPKDLDLLNRIFRVAHTIKGSSSFLGFDVLTRLTHNMEDVLNKARKGDLEITHEVMDVILESVDLMKALLEAIKDSGSDDRGIEIDNTVKKLEAVSNGESLSDVAQEEEKQEENGGEEKDYSNLSAQEVEAEIERLLAERQEQDRQKRKAKKQAQQEKATEAKVEEKIEKKTEKEIKKAEAPKEERVPTTSIEQTVRVDVKRLDHLMNLIGELVLGKNRLLRIHGDISDKYNNNTLSEELNQIVSSISTVTTDLQLAVMKTRMLPIVKVFNKFPRMVRDLSRELGKSIELIMSGEETELDKSIIEEIGDPLVHIIRNSCDHGIESPEVRAERGKSETGKIILKAYNEGNHIVIEIQDDGKGLDPEALKSKALEKGLITDRDVATMSDKEAFSLIFKAGFSTAAAITNISGRGVGMDVVKTNIEKLNGIIDVESQLGLGTTLKLKIPLTLAIIQALIVGVQEEFYAIPLSSVLETVRISQEEIYTVDGKSVLRLRDEVLPLVHMSSIFEVKNDFGSAKEIYVVIIGLAEQKIGMIVDCLIGQEEVVIKSLGEYLKNIQGIAGATVRGDGKITLIVDVVAIMEMGKNIKVNLNKIIEEKQIQNANRTPKDFTVLITDDSSTYRAIAQNYLQEFGVQTLEAQNGLEALEILKKSEKNIDAVLVDIEMPKMDGYTLASEVRKISKFRNLPLIAVTSMNSKNDRIRGVEAGMTEYISKPYSKEYLFKIIRRCLKLDDTERKDND